MSFYKKLKVENLELLQNKIYDSLPKTILENGMPAYVGNKDESIQHFLNIPEFRSLMDTLGITEHIKSCIINLCGKLEHNTVHRDYQSDFSYSINIPIKNCENTYITFYKVKDEPLHIDNLVGDVDYPFELCEQIEKVEMIQPIFVDITVPHTFTNLNDNQRIVLLVRVDKKI